MSTSLFAHLALKFSAHPENLATEALGFLLQSSEAARAGLRQILMANNLSIPEHLVWATQAAGEDGSRPDLAGWSASGAAVFIEAKFWAGLTPNQPLRYLEQLPLNGALLFVVPERRRDIVWHELMRRVEDAKLDHLAGTGGRRELRLQGKTLALVDWREFCSTLQARVEADGDVAAGRSLSELQGLCERMDSQAFLPLTSAELTTDTYRRVLQFGAMVDEIVEALKREGLASTDGLRSAAVNGRYGRYLRLHGVCCQVMCCVWKWTTYASTPLWLQVYGSSFFPKSAPGAIEALRGLQARVPPQMFVANDGFPVVPLFVPTSVERADVLTSALEQIKTLIPLTEHLASKSPAEEVPLDDASASS